MKEEIKGRSMYAIISDIGGYKKLIAGYESEPNSIDPYRLSLLKVNLQSLEEELEELEAQDKFYIF